MGTYENRSPSRNEQLNMALEERLKKEKGRKKSLPALGAALLILAIFTVILMAVIRLGRNHSFDENAAIMSTEELSKEDLRALLQDQADESMFRVMINTAPVSEDGKIADWCIINSASNSYDMQIVVSTADSRQLYTSEVLSPGEQILTGALDESLPPGTYQATATAYAYDRETGQEIGEVNVDIILTVGKTADESVSTTEER